MDNSPALGEYRRSVYTHGVDPSWVSQMNEQFTIFKQGILYGPKLIDEVVEALKQDLNPQ